MADWLSYSPADFIMLSEPVYWGLVAQANAPWPAAPLLSAAAGALFLLRPPWAALALSAVWAWVGWSFVWSLAGPVNAVAGHAAPGFAVQCVLLTVLARGASPQGGAIPKTLLVWGVLLHPLSAMAFGRPMIQAEIFALTADPLAIATLGFALAIGDWRGAILAVIPALWLAISAVTLDVFGAPERWISIAVLALAAIEAARRLISGRR